MIKNLQNKLNFFGVLGLCLSVCFGFFIEFFYHEKPCSLCFLQRASMLGIAIGLYLNLARGIQVKHYAMSLLWNLLGFSEALRHMALNVCKTPEAPPFLFLSFRIYTWSFLVFFLSFCGITSLLFLYKAEKEGSSKILSLLAAGGLLVTLFFGVFSILTKRGLTF